MKADMKGLHQLDAAILMEELTDVNAMLHFGTEEEKKRARKLLEEHYQPIICQHLNRDALKLAQIELGFSDFELGFPDTQNIF